MTDVDNADTQEIRHPPCASFLARVGILCCRTIRAVKYSIVLILLLGLYLSLVGFPEPVTTWVIQEGTARGMSLSFDRLRLDLRRGLVADSVELGFVESSETLAMSCAELHININWNAWQGEEGWLQGLGVRNGTIYPGALSILPEKLDQPWLVMSNLVTFVAFEEEQVRLQPFSAMVHGLPITGAGILHARPSLDASSGGLGENPSVKRAAIAIERPDIQKLLNRLWPVLKDLTWSDDSELHFDFDIHPTNHALDEVKLSAHGAGVSIRGQSFTDWKGIVNLEGANLTIEEISLGHKEERARLTGELDVQSREIKLHGYSGLEPTCLLSLIPYGWAEAVQKQIQVEKGTLETECWVGPVQFRDMATAITGWTKLKQARYRNIWIEDGFASWTLNVPQIELDRFKFICGQGRAQGPMEGCFAYNVMNGEWSGDMVTQLDPHVLLPITPTNLVKLTHAFEFSGKNPRIALALSAAGSPKPQLTFKGNFEAKDFSYQDVQGLSTDSGITYSNRVIRLDPFYAERDEGDLHGWLTLDRNSKCSDFDMKSSMHPQAIAQLIHTNIGRLVQRMGVEGIGRWTANGRADYGAKTNSNFNVHARLHDAKLWRLRSKELDLMFSSLTTNLQFNIAQSEMFGGSFTGKIDIAQTQPTRKYTAQFAVTNAYFGRVLDLISTKENLDLKGRLTGSGRFAGTLRPFELPNTTGSGEVRISEGTLFRLPILGGLSTLLSKVFPGLGYASQRDLTATYELRDEKVYSDDILISGRVASIQMKGRYHVGHNLAFDVKGQPLGRGVVADVVQLITMPISELLEFRLHGTLKDPEWKPKHWPKELMTSESEKEPPNE